MIIEFSGLTAINHVILPFFKKLIFRKIVIFIYKIRNFKNGKKEKMITLDNEN